MRLRSPVLILLAAAVAVTALWMFRGGGLGRDGPPVAMEETGRDGQAPGQDAPNGEEDTAPPDGEAGAAGDGDDPGADSQQAAGSEQAAGSQPGDGAAEPGGFDWRRVVEGLDRPLYVTHAGDGSNRLFIVEQPGRVWVLKDGILLPEPFLDIRDLTTSRGEQGLLGLAFHPRFTASGWVYVSYTGRDGASVLARYRVRDDDPDRVDTPSAEVLLRVEQPYRNHNGGLIKFGPDGYLYFGLGDGGSGGDPLGHGQNPETLLGAMLRLDVDVDGDDDGEKDGNGIRGYGIPPDNPFAGDNHPWRDEIWAFGLRNPWRFSFDRDTGDLYIGDVGQNHMEEVNFQPAGSPGGENYGWNVWEGSSRFTQGTTVSEAVSPVTGYATGQDGCAVTGGYVYRGTAVPTLRGVYLFADYCEGTLWGLRRTAGGWVTAELAVTGLVIASFGEDEEGEVYLVDHRGAVYRLVPGDRAVPGELLGP